MAGLEVEGLFTAALGLQAPWPVQKVDLNAAKHRIDFEVASQAKRLSYPSCGACDQAIHDRVRRSWRHLDFFQFEAWLHAPVPRVGCTSCGKTTQVPVPELYANDFASFMKARQKLLMELVTRITGHAAPTTAEPVEAGEDIPASMAQDSGLVLVEAD